MTESVANDDPVQLTLGETYPEIRELVRRICSDFPGSYWRALEEKQAYPTEFVAALTKAGLLGSLIPEEYGGLGMPLGAAAATLEEIHASGCNAGACHAQMYIMGTVLRHGSPAQKQKYLPDIAAGRLRLQAFGVTEPTSGSDTTQAPDAGRAKERSLPGHRPKGLDVARAAIRSHAAAGAHDAIGRGEEEKRGALGLPGRRQGIARPRTGHQAAASDGQSQHDRSLFRVPASADGEFDRRGRQRLPLHSRQHECRAHPGRVRSNWRRALVHRKGVEICRRTRGVRSADRPQSGRPVPDRQGLRQCRGGRR